MDIYVHAKEPKPEADESIVISEWRWQPVCSIMAIANETIRKRTGELAFRRDLTEDLDGQYGYGIMDPETLNQVADEMLRLADCPEELEAYGMRVELKDGSYIYTYPIEACTSSVERKDDGDLVFDTEGINSEDIRSCFWISEKSLKEVIKFFKSSGGFGLPYK